MRLPCLTAIESIAIISAGAAVGIASNEVNRSNRVPYFAFSKKDLLESRLAKSVSQAFDGGAQSGTARPVSSRPRPMEIVLFFAECAECSMVQAKVLPEIRRLFGAAVAIREYDCADMASYKKLIDYEKRYGSGENVMMKMFIGEHHYLAGPDVIASRALPAIKKALGEKESDGR